MNFIFLNDNHIGIRFFLLLFHIASWPLLPDDEVFHGKVEQHGCYIFVEYLCYYKHVVGKMHPSYKMKFIYNNMRKKKLLTAFALPPTCIALRK